MARLHVAPSREGTVYGEQAEGRLSSSNDGCSVRADSKGWDGSA
jgi:hypothetical protein